jgi:hypothetical protein
LGASGWLCLGFRNWRWHGRFAGCVVVVMSEQPKAIWLAGLLDGDRPMHCNEAADELRRLYQLAQEQHTEIYGLRLEVRNLLGILIWWQEQMRNDDCDDMGKLLDAMSNKASAAIAKSTGETK